MPRASWRGSPCSGATDATEGTEGEGSTEGRAHDCPDGEGGSDGGSTDTESDDASGFST